MCIVLIRALYSYVYSARMYCTRMCTVLVSLPWLQLQSLDSQTSKHIGLIVVFKHLQTAHTCEESGKLECVLFTLSIGFNTKEGRL